MIVYGNLFCLTNLSTVRFFSSSHASGVIIICNWFYFYFFITEGWPISICLQVFWIFISLIYILELFITYWFECLPFIDSRDSVCSLDMSPLSVVGNVSPVSQWLSLHSLNSSSVWAEVLSFNAFKFINYFLYSFCFFCQFKTFFTTQISWIILLFYLFIPLCTVKKFILSLGSMYL